MSATAGVSAALVAPQGTQGRFIEEQRDECGLLIGAVLEVVRTLTGRDLFAELLEPIAGDFDMVSAMQQGWLHLGDAAQGVERGWTGLGEQLARDWEGEAANGAGESVGRTARLHGRQARACALIGDQLGHLVEVARSTTEVVCAALRFIDSLIQEYLLDAALGPVGAVKAVAQAKAKVQRLVTLIDRAVEAVNALVRAVQAVTAVLRRLDALLAALETGLAVGNDAGHLAAGSWLEETARAGFTP